MAAGNIREVDYIIFGCSLVVPFLIGVYFSCIKKQKSNAEFLMASRSMSCVPMSVSLCVSYMSAVMIIGVPGQIAYKGWLFPFTFLISLCSAATIAGVFFIPMLYKMKLVSVYEYLEMRFNSKVVRCLASANYAFAVLLAMGVITYAPCLALSTITGLPVYSLIIISGIIGTLYTVMGGLKTVVWADVFQSLIICTTLIAVMVKGILVGNGFSRIWEVAVETKRVQWANWDVSPFVTDATPGIFFGQMFIWISIFSCHQTQVQRYFATKSLTQARWSLSLSVVLICILNIFTLLSGIIVYGCYWACDPKEQGLTKKIDELIPYFTLEYFTEHPGLIGVFMAGLFSGSLSTVSSGLNSLEAVVWEDIFVSFGIADGRLITGRANVDSDLTIKRRQVTITRSIGIVLGVIVISLAVMSSRFEGILQLASTSSAVMAGPLVATFLTGFFFPSSNAVGAIFGIILGDALALWLLIGSFVRRPEPGPTLDLPDFTIGCDQPRETWHSINVTEAMGNYTANLMVESTGGIYVPEGDWQTILYSISFHLYSICGFVVCFVVNLVVSYITRGILILQKKELPKVEPFLLHPLVRGGKADSCCCGDVRNQGAPGYKDDYHSDRFRKEDRADNTPNEYPSLSMVSKKDASRSVAPISTVYRPMTGGYHNYENYDTYEMERKAYFTSLGGTNEKKGTLDHKVHPDRARMFMNDKDHDVGNRKRGSRPLGYIDSYFYTPHGARGKVEINHASEERLDEFGDVVVKGGRHRTAESRKSSFDHKLDKQRK